MESSIWNIWNPESDIQHFPVFTNVIILTNSVEVDTNVHEVLCKWSREECVRGGNHDPGKG